MCSLPKSGVEPVSPALAGRFFTTEPPGKPHTPFFFQPNNAAASAAAKSLQSCPTLCDPTDGSPPGSSVHGILQARTLERVAIAFSSGDVRELHLLAVDPEPLTLLPAWLGCPNVTSGKEPN